MRSLRAIIIILSLVVSLAVTNLPSSTPRAKADATSFLNAGTENALISDGAFTDINSMSAAEIQIFLQNEGGFLAHYSENGRTAAQIIYDASHGHGEASGDINGITIDSTTGTVNPKVLLVTLQKEQSLITMTTQNNAALQTAMGYGCPDSGGCNATYAGFTNQVEWAAWQFRYNFDAAQENAAWRTQYYGSGNAPYFIGQTVVFSDYNGSHTVTFSDAATASLYRYTPHVFDGNYNFWLTYNTWFSMPLVDADYVTQGPWDAAHNVNIAFSPGETATATVTITNTGFTTWRNTGTNQVRLGVTNDRSSIFLPNSPYGANRAAVLDQSSVPSGSNGTFTFTLTAPSTPGTYHEDFQPVMEFVTWFGPTIDFSITVLSPNASYVTQEPWNAAQNVNIASSPGETVNASVTIANTGSATWHNNGSNPVDLGVTNDRMSQVLTNRINRAGTLSQSSVAPGQNGTFQFSFTMPTKTGSYTEQLQPVMELTKWFGPIIQFSILVAPPNAQYVTQGPWDGVNNANLVLARGQSGTATLTLNNNGAGSWSQTGANQVRLGVLNDVWSPFLLNSPYGGNRAAILDQSSVASGNNGSFTFTLTAPASMTPGTYLLHLQPVMEQIKWFGPIVEYKIIVQ